MLCAHFNAAAARQRGRIATSPERRTRCLSQSTRNSTRRFANTVSCIPHTKRVSPTQLFPLGGWKPAIERFRQTWASASSTWWRRRSSPSRRKRRVARDRNHHQQRRVHTRRRPTLPADSLPPVSSLVQFRRWSWSWSPRRRREGGEGGGGGGTPSFAIHSSTSVKNVLYLKNLI